MYYVHEYVCTYLNESQKLGKTKSEWQWSKNQEFLPQGLWTPDVDL